jgi:hypothetical protein
MTMYANLDTAEIDQIDDILIDAEECVIKLTLNLKYYLATHDRFDGSYRNHGFASLRDYIGTLRVNAASLSHRLQLLREVTETDFETT